MAEISNLKSKSINAAHLINDIYMLQIGFVNQTNKTIFY